MKITNIQNNIMILKEIGNRIKQYRISFPMTQEELSKMTGISVRSIVRIEKGDDTQFSNIVKILNQFDLVENLNLLIVDPENRPSYHFEKRIKLRKRATKKK